MSTIERLVKGELPLDHNWNKVNRPQLIQSEPTPTQATKAELVSEDLRDGLHGITQYPEVAQMVDYIGRIYDLGIRDATVGIYPGEGNKIGESIEQVIGEMSISFPDMRPIVLCMATQKSLEWTAKCKGLNDNLNAIVFMGTAPSRLLVEEWDQQMILDRLSSTIYKATDRYDIDVIGATEHTTQTPPDFLDKIVTAQVESGAKIFCIADTIGTSRPVGTYNIVTHVRNHLENIGRPDVKIDWHGHRDMDNATTNALVAISAGANRIHTVAGGIGERAGNTQLEAVLVNLDSIISEEGLVTPWKLSKISSILFSYKELAGISNSDHGTLGDRSHRTSLGIHTAAMLKATALASEAEVLGENEIAQKLNNMARTIYSSIDPNKYGKEHNIVIGPWSGSSTVKMAYLSVTGKSPDNLTDSQINTALENAKQLGRELTLEEMQMMFESMT